jgi:uncharacterized protein (DUF983 family)
VANIDEGSTATDLGDVPAAIVPVEVSAPVVASMVYMEMVLRAQKAARGLTMLKILAPRGRVR